MWVLAIGPWKVIKGVSWVLNRWQRFVYPVSYGVFYGGDAMDKASAGGVTCLSNLRLPIGGVLRRRRHGQGKGCGWSGKGNARFIRGQGVKQQRQCA